MLDKRIKISPLVSIGPQVDQEGLEKLAKAGFKTIINLSSRGEADQILKPQIEGELISDLSMEYRHFPVFLASLKADHITSFCDMMSEVPTPVYVHCKMGQRTVLLALIYHALRKGLNATKIFSKADKLGIEFRSPFYKEFIESNLKRFSTATPVLH